MPQHPKLTRALFAYANKPTWGLLLAYLAVLKLSRSDLFNRLLENDVAANRDALEWLQDVGGQRTAEHAADTWENSYMDEIRTLYQIIAKHCDPEVSGSPMSMIMRNNPPGRASLKRFEHQMQTHLRMIDLPIS